MVGFSTFTNAPRPLPGAHMHAALLLPLLLSLLSLGLPARAFGADAPSLAFPEKIQGLHKPIEPTMPIYKPRKGSALRGRVDGGFRGGVEGEPVLHVLAPADHVGETLKKSPALYWYLSQPTTLPVEFTLENSQQPKPLLVTELKSPACSGIQMIRLSDLNQVLEEEIQYRWHISLIVDAESRSKDIHAMGFIELVPFTQAIFEGRTGCKDTMDVFCLYVTAGLWYDAVQVISDLIMAYPKDRVLRLMRASLLEQVGLNDVAEWDRMQNGTPCPPARAEMDAPLPQLANGKVKP